MDKYNYPFLSIYIPKYTFVDNYNALTYPLKTWLRSLSVGKSKREFCKADSTQAKLK